MNAVMNTLSANANSITNPICAGKYYAKFVNSQFWVQDSNSPHFSNVGQVVLSLLVLSSIRFPTQVSLGTGVVSIGVIGHRFINYRDLKDAERREIGDPKNLVWELTKVVSAMASSVFYPKATAVVCNSYQIVRDLSSKEFLNNIASANYSGVTYTFLACSSRVAFISSLVIAKPQFIAASLLSNAILDFAFSIRAFSAASLLSVTSVAIGIIRLYACRSVCLQHNLFARN